MLLALLDGRSLPAGELARAADLSAAATSLHLAKLASGGLVTVRQSGRHRYYTLASSEVAHALEALGTIATAQPQARSLSPKVIALRRARSCYDHLAGELAVKPRWARRCSQGLLEDRWVARIAGSRQLRVTPRGERGFAAFGVR